MIVGIFHMLGCLAGKADLGEDIVCRCFEACACVRTARSVVRLVKNDATEAPSTVRVVNKVALKSQSVVRVIQNDA